MESKGEADSQSHDDLQALTDKMLLAFASLPSEEIEARLIRTFAVLRRSLGEEPARQVFDGLAESFDLLGKLGGRP